MTHTSCEQQQTLKSASRFSGSALFSGAPASGTLRPAETNAGISFRRTDLDDSPSVPALVDFVVDRPRRTALQRGEAIVETVEHCLAALAGMGVDNAVVEIDGPELPAGDGSARLFVDALREAGVVGQGAPRRPLVITESVMVREGEAMVAALPGDASETELMYVLDYGPTSPIARQIHSFKASPDAFLEQIASARTFSTQHEAEAMWRRGMFKHLTPRDMLVIGDKGPIDNTYRFQDEPVRHKVLDLLGDLSLLGRPIQGRIVAVRSGHALNHRLARELLAQAPQPVRSPSEPHSHPLSPSTPDSRPGGASQGAGEISPAMDIRSILRVLPHRYPMVMVDRVLEMDGDRRAVGVKNVSINEPYFQGHFPGTPIMPGVLVVEAMCQLAGLMLSQKLERTGKIAVLLSLDGVRLRKSVTPGDQVVLESEAIRANARFGDVQCRAFVGGDLVAEARVKFLMVDAEEHGR